MAYSHSFTHSFNTYFYSESTMPTKALLSNESELKSIHCHFYGCVILSSYLAFLSLFPHVKTKANDTTLHGCCED